MPQALRVLGVLVLGLFSAEGLAAQTRDARAAARGTAVLSGVVVSDDADARPVRKARVTCSSPDVSGHTTITDDGGRFMFAGLPAGRFTVTASKAAWVTASYGAKRPLRPGTAIPLADGQRIDIAVRLPRGGVITGVILDHNNQPAAGAPVTASRQTIVNGERHLASGGRAITDDRGAYRIFGLAPGDYAVNAVGGAGLGPALSSELRLTSDADVRYVTRADPRTPPPTERAVALAATYFPGSTMASQAGLVTVRAGEERDGIDITLQLVHTVRVEGIVSLPGGTTPPGTSVHLIASVQNAVSAIPLEGLRPTVTGVDGTFAFAGVPPGQYTILARAARPIVYSDGTRAGPPQIVWASTSVAVDGDPVTGLTLSLEPGLTISGQVRFEATKLKPPADLRSIRLTAWPSDSDDSLAFATGPMSAGADGRFSIAGVTPGRYRLTASFPGSGRPGGWLLKSIVAAGQDALDGTFTLPPNQHVLDATVTFTDHLAQLSGTLHDAAGSPAADDTVVLFPVEQALWVPQSRRIQGVRPSADGGYVIRNLPAGDYFVVAIDDVEPGEWFDPAFLQRLLPAAVRVSVADGEQKVQAIRLGGG